VQNGGFCKKVDLSLTQGALCTVSVFFVLHFTCTYLGGGGGMHQKPPVYRPAGVVSQGGIMGHGGYGSVREWAKGVIICAEYRSVGQEAASSTPSC